MAVPIHLVGVPPVKVTANTPEELVAKIAEEIHCSRVTLWVDSTAGAWIETDDTFIELMSSLFFPALVSAIYENDSSIQLASFNFDAANGWMEVTLWGS